jgi:DNA-binding transcriptional MerR regulator
MTNKRDTSFGIKELADLGGVSRRTVRYYVQRGLLPTPTGTGRGSHYTQEHLDRLVQIRTWQEDGVTLAEIERRVGLQPEATPEMPPPVAAVPGGEDWTRITLHPGVELHVQTQTSLTEADTDRILKSIRAVLGGTQ